MRSARARIALLAAATTLAHVATCPAADLMRVAADDAETLKASLLALTQQQLQAAGIVADGSRAWLELSAKLPAASTFEVRPLWSTQALNVASPLPFDLRPAGTSAAPWIRATLAVGLQREVWVAARRLRRGSAVTCDDFAARLRSIRELPQARLAAPCAIDPQAVALRDIAAGDLIRTTDIGQPPAVSAGRPVNVSVAANAVSVTTTAIALADASIGDQVDVRLQHPMRTLRTRVTGPGSVQLMDPQQ